ncbi:MAG: hypothetical protein FJ403_09620 [Verrucomicrobia bacterium]|nr:hypothetical protein [Verrucomicrobiota bacterium]
MTPSNPVTSPAPNGTPCSRSQRALDWIEWAGNKLPDPAVLFLIALVLTWVASAALAPMKFAETDPRTILRDAAGNITSPTRDTASSWRGRRPLAGELLFIIQLAHQMNNE